MTNFYQKSLFAYDKDPKQKDLKTKALVEDFKVKEKILKDFNAITGLNLSSYDEVTTYIGSNGEKIYSYYEYYQFKRMKFKCEVSNIKYDDVSGRISYMEFTATGEIE